MILLAGIVYAHPGRTDSYGCHTCRTNCASLGLSYGEYHCHRSKGLPQPEPPVKSSSDGYTVPAPEYNYPKTSNNVYNQPAQVNQSDNGSDGSILGWVFGLGMGGALVYYIYKNRK